MSNNAFIHKNASIFLRNCLIIILPILRRCGPVMPYGDIYLFEKYNKLNNKLHLFYLFNIEIEYCVPQKSS